MQLLKLCQQASGYRASGTAYTLAEIQRYKCKPNKILYLTFNYLTFNSSSDLHCWRKIYYTLAKQHMFAYRQSALIG